MPLAHDTGALLSKDKMLKRSNIKLLECPIPAPPLSQKSGSLLFLLYFSNLVKWISPKLQTVFLTT